jgi:phosphoglycerate dehydrogenase-like enzyme
VKVAFLSKARPELLSRIPPDLPHHLIAADDDGVYSREDLAKLAEVEGLLVSAEPVHDQLLEACPRLKIVQRMGVGYNSVDLEACARRGIPACNVAGVNKEAVAEHGMALMLALVKRLREADALTRRRDWAGARLLTRRTCELAGKTLGIVGLGDTGSSLARRARAFDMAILYNDIREIDRRVVEELEATPLDKDALFARADIVSINTDLNPTSRGMVDSRRIALMQPHALLICCARGNIVDEAALRAALEEGRIAGAGMDVYTSEPILPGNPLLGAPNLLMTAHVAGVNPETGRRAFGLAMDNVRAVLERGEKPRWVLNGVN